MTNKARMALAGLALGTVVLSGCWHGCRQTYSGTSSTHNRTPTASTKNDWHNSPTARQQAPYGAQPAGSQPVANQQAGFPAATTTPGAQQYGYPNNSRQVQPTGLPTSGQSYRQPSGMSIPTPAYHSVPGVPGTTGEQASPTGNANPLTSAPLPQDGSNPTTAGVPATARPIQAAPFPQAPAPGFPPTTYDSTAGPAIPNQPLR